jgi:membrane protease YdiL (CAAX protease family)
MTSPDPSSQEPDQDRPLKVPSRQIPAVALIHQEGVIGVIAVVGLSFREPGLLRAITPPIGLGASLFYGAVVGAVCFGAMWLARNLEPLRELEAWQQKMVSGWTVTDALAVALLSGLAEEALIRALLQPIIGLVPAALLFAVLHVIPERRLWLWPVIALALGVVLGLLFERAGYPAAVIAHVLINAFSLMRLRRPDPA